MSRLALALLCLVMLSVQPAAAQTYAQLLSQDLPGAKDHPWTGRYGGSVILLQTFAAFDAFTFPAGKAVARSGKRSFERVVTAEGQLTRTIYATPPGRSSLEVFRNFQNQFQSQGFAADFQCAGADGCGEPFKEMKYHWNNKDTHVGGANLPQIRRSFATAVFDGARDIRYALFRKGQGANAAYIGLYVALNQGGTYGDLSKALSDRVTALVEVIEPRAMENRIEMLKSDEIASGLRTEGAVALYGLLFETDQAVLRAESGTQLDEMAAFLKREKARVFIVGHTDTLGALDYNLSLSDRRARAVQAALQSRGVPAAQMAARGIGPLSPVATNTSDAGRAKNRRVELVLQ